MANMALFGVIWYQERAKFNPEMRNLHLIGSYVIGSYVIGKTYMRYPTG